MLSKSTWCVVAAVFAAWPTFAKGILDYAAPQSDALVYLDIAQAEKSMDKKLWKKIEEDKKAAKERERAEAAKAAEGDEGDGDGLMRGFADLNPEVVVNVTLVSRSPLRLMAEGAVRFQSGGAEAAKRALKDLVEALSSDDESAPVSLSVKDSGNGVHEFLFLYNLKKKVSLPPSPPSPSRRRMFDALRESATSCFVLMNSIRWVLLLPRNEECQSLRKLMTLADSVGASASVKDRTVRLLAEADFRREGDAVSYSRDAEALARDVKKVLTGSIVGDVSATSRNKSVSIAVDVDIGGAWGVLGSISR